MDFLGTVEETTSEGRVIVKAEALPDVGDMVFDQRRTRMGSVRRIFGPVDGPYVSVSVSDRSLLDGIKGSKIYYEGVTQHGKGKRRNRRD